MRVGGGAGSRARHGRRAQGEPQMWARGQPHGQPVSRETAHSKRSQPDHSRHLGKKKKEYYIVIMFKYNNSTGRSDTAAMCLLLIRYC